MRLAMHNAPLEYLARLAHWDTWYPSSIVKTLYDNEQTLASMSITFDSITASIIKHHKPWSKHDWNKVQRSYQRTTYKTLRQCTTPDLARRRYKLSNWSTDIL